MTNSDEFKKALLGISETYKQTMSEAEIKIWWYVFKSYDIKDFRSAVFAHIQCPDQGVFPPRPAHIKKILDGTSKDQDRAIADQAAQAWEQVHNKIRLVGPYDALVLDDKIALAAVKIIGGWKYLCSLTTHSLEFKRKEFIEAYRASQAKPLDQLPSSLAGILPSNNEPKKLTGPANITERLKLLGG